MEYLELFKVYLEAKGYSKEVINEIVIESEEIDRGDVETEGEI